MVTVIDRFNRAASAGSALGQGLGQAAGTIGQRSFERNQVSNALSSLKNLKPGANAFEVAKSLIEGTSGLPEQGRILQALYGPLLEQMRSQSQSSPDAEKATGEIKDLLESREQNFKLPNFQVKQDGLNQIQRPGRPPPTRDFEGPPATFENVLPSIKRTLGEKYFPNVQTPDQVSSEESFKPLLKPFKPLPIGVDEKRKIRTSLKNQGITDAKIQDQYIADTIQEQKDAYEAALSGFQNVEEYQKAKKQEDDRFFNEVQPNIQARYGSLSDPELNIWKGISRLSENSGPDEARLRNTNEMFNQLVYEPIRSFDNIGPILPYGSVVKPSDVKDNLEDARSTIQDNIQRIEERQDLPSQLKGEVKNYLRDRYAQSMAAKDWGTAQQAYAVANINPKLASGTPIAPKPIETFAETVYLPKNRQEHIQKLSNHLIKSLRPDDSLILAREKALENNYDDRAFNEALRIALASGLKLSDFQNQERPKLSVPQRLDLDSIMRGKRSIFDLFKAKK